MQTKYAPRLSGLKEKITVGLLTLLNQREMATTRRDANGILLSAPRTLEMIALHAKDASECIELLIEETKKYEQKYSNQQMC